MIPYFASFVNVQLCRWGCTVWPSRVFNLGGVTVQLERFDCSVSNGQGVQRGRYIHRTVSILEKAGYRGHYSLEFCGGQSDCEIERVLAYLCEAIDGV